jgi:hypothetical protein
MRTASNKVDAAEEAAVANVGCNIPVGWVKTEERLYSESTAT